MTPEEMAQMVKDLIDNPVVLTRMLANMATEATEMRDEIEQFRHREWHYLLMLEECGIDSHSARDSECAAGADCEYFETTKDSSND